MKQKSTAELLKELEKFSSFEEYKRVNNDCMINKTLSQYLNELIAEKNVSKAEVIRKSEMGETYAYQLFSGLKKAPARDKLICLAIGMNLSVDETNGLLKLGGLLSLYPRVKRDSIIIIGINNNKGVSAINEELFESKEETLN